MVFEEHLSDEKQIINDLSEKIEPMPIEEKVTLLERKIKLKIVTRRSLLLALLLINIVVILLLYFLGPKYEEAYNQIQLAMYSIIVLAIINFAVLFYDFFNVGYRTHRYSKDLIQTIYYGYLYATVYHNGEKKSKHYS